MRFWYRGSFTSLSAAFTYPTREGKGNNLSPESLPSMPDWISELAPWVGIFISLFALYDSRKSRKAADRAAKAAEDSAKEAKNSNLIAKEALEFEKSKHEDSKFSERQDLIRKIVDESIEKRLFYGGPHEIMKRYPDLTPEEKLTILTRYQMATKREGK